MVKKVVKKMENAGLKMNFINNFGCAVMMSNFYYMRGVAPKEAKGVIFGKNWRVQVDIALTNRGKDTSRLAFGMNEPGLRGVNPSVVSDFILEANFYANLGAYAEANPDLSFDLKRDININHRGYLLIFSTKNPLPIHQKNLTYGKNWRTTSELPPGIENCLVGVMPAQQMRSPSCLESYKMGEFSLCNNFTTQDFDVLKQVI